MTRKYLPFILFAALLIGCQSSPQFSVSGTITGAEGEWLYLEHTALTKTMIVDSCTLNADGKFNVQAVAPAHPDFYRIRVDNRSLPLSIDSIEKIEVHTTLDSLPYTLSIEGSESSLVIAQLRATARTSTREELRNQAQQIIIQNPRSLAAYYAVFLKQGGEYIWNIFDPTDRKMYQVVATSFNAWMPDYERTKTLYNQVLEVMQAERSAKNQQTMRQFIDEAENAFLDITLPDEQGDLQSLSDLRGSVIILDFSSSEIEQYTGYKFELRELYNKYNQRGLEIYSVSFDRNQFIWQEAIANLPWTTVWADANVAAPILMQYNVQSLPTLFLFDRKGNIQGRYIDFKALDADIRKYL